jgi:predicted ATP-binding protein involved in virulence
MLTVVLSELVASIEVQALVLFDEPELYLHPDALSALARAFHGILHAFDSFAVLSTHSPLLLQEIPARRVRILSREGNVPIVDELQIESFGESLSVISDTVFQATGEQENYRTYLAALAAQYGPEVVLSKFAVGGGLGLNARMALQSLSRPPRRVS